MRLREHRDFQQAIVQAAEHFADRGLRPALIEKDYYVTETLRVIADNRHHGVRSRPRGRPDEARGLFRSHRLRH